jgi:hypothetical protein
MAIKSRIYIDTSVIGGCLDSEFCYWSQKLIKDFHTGIFIPVVSRLTEFELRSAPEEVQEVYAELKDANLEFLEISEAASALMECYLNRKILSPQFQDDALHIAIATVEKVDIVVSWNFRHIVHFDKIRLFNQVNAEMGYQKIEIYSPREVVSYGNQSG